jgi:glycerol kinase
MKQNVLVLDVGTTGVKAFIFDSKLNQLSKAYEKYPIRSKKKGWVEQDPNQLLTASIKVIKETVKKSKVRKSSIKSFGITNQRETTILWDKTTGKPVYPAIVWQDMRTQAFCKSLKKKWEKKVRSKTGLVLDPYFSASKVRWILKNVPKARTLASQKKLAFGTVDTWLVWNLCEGNPHVTDHTNAARTLLMNIKTKKWGPELLKLFEVPASILPKIQAPSSNFGTLKKEILGIPLPLTTIIGDQQSSFYAATQTATKKGPVTKITYGTGVFVMQTIGKSFKTKDPFFTTLVPKGKGSEYAFEAKVGISGPEVEKRLGKPEELKKYLYKLAKQTDRYIKKLPVKPKEIIIDGGSSRDGLILAIQEDVTGISTQPLIMYDGTALGTAMLQLNN